MRRLFVSGAEISQMVLKFGARDDIAGVRMFLWRVPRVLRYYRQSRFWTKPYLGAKWLYWMLK